MPRSSSLLPGRRWSPGRRFSCIRLRRRAGTGVCEAELGPGTRLARGANLLQHLLEVLAGLVLLHALGEHQLGGEDSLGVREHLLLTGGEALLLVALRQVPDDLRELEDVPRLHLVAVVLEAAVPVLRHLAAVTLQHAGDLVDRLL